MKARIRPFGALAGVAVAVAVGAAPASADPVNIGEGHWDIAIAYECDGGSIEEIHVHNHDTEQELEVADVVFDVPSATTSATPWSTVFGSAVRFIDPNSEDFVVGLDVEYIGECEDEVTVTRTGTPSLSTNGSRAAAFLAADAPDTVFDSATGTGLNEGVTIAAHTDLFWGFTHAGQYVLQLSATPTLGGASVNAPITFSVS